MQGVPSRHPPGAVVMLSGEIPRYAISMHCLHSLLAPAGCVVDKATGRTANSQLNWEMGCLIARSLNNGIGAMMSNPDLQWVWIMGDDHTYSADTLIKLLDRELPVVAPLCLNRMPPMDPTIIDNRAGRMKYIEDLPAGGLYRLEPHETCGDAGLLIRREVLEATGPVWYERIKSGSHMAEDQEFVDKIKAKGFPVHVDLDVQIGHVGIVDFRPVRKATGWEVRLIGGGKRHICDVEQVRDRVAEAAE